VCRTLRNDRYKHLQLKNVTLPKSTSRESSSTFLELFAYAHVWEYSLLWLARLHVTLLLRMSASKAQLAGACKPVELLCRLITLKVDRHSFLNHRCTSAVLECVCMNEFSRPVLHAGQGTNMIPRHAFSPPSIYDL
jgi:hypothetical protein